MAPYPRWLGLQPPRPDRPRQRRRPAHGVDPRHGERGAAAGDPAGPRRGDVHAEPAGRHPGHRRGDRRPRLGVPPGPARRPRRLHDRQPHRHQPQHRHPRRADHRHHHGRLHHRPPRGDRRGGVGDRDPRLHGEPRQPDLGADHGRRQGVLGPQLRPPGRAGDLRHHRPRRGDRRGAVAAPAHPRAGRARRRDLGGGAVRGARPRRLVDGAELRPRAEPAVRGHVGHLAGPEVHAGGRRSDPPLPQLDPGPRRRHRRDRLVLPAHERPLGPRPPVRAPARRHRGAARPLGGGLDQPAHPARRGAAGAHRHSRQDGHRLYARPRDRRVPVGDGRPSPRTW